MLEHAEYFESWIQGWRRRRLQELYGAAHVEEILYCSDSAHSQQNRCLVSGRRLAVDDRGDGPSGHAAFLRLLERQLLKFEAVLPVDLRVRGLVSAKYGHDGTALDGNRVSLA